MCTSTTLHTVSSQPPKVQNNMKRNSRSTKKKPAKDGRTTLAFARAEMPFVVSTPQSATAPPDNTQRTFVRSHVMQNYLHGKSFIVPKSSFRELPSLSKEAAPNAKKQMSCFRLEKPLVKKKVAAIRPRPIEEEEYDIEVCYSCYFPSLSLMGSL